MRNSSLRILGLLGFLLCLPALAQLAQTGAGSGGSGNPTANNYYFAAAFRGVPLKSGTTGVATPSSRQYQISEFHSGSPDYATTNWRCLLPHFTTNTAVGNGVYPDEITYVATGTGAPSNGGMVILGMSLSFDSGANWNPLAWSGVTSGYTINTSTAPYGSITDDLLSININGSTVSSVPANSPVWARTLWQLPGANGTIQWTIGTYVPALNNGEIGLGNSTNTYASFMNATGGYVPITGGAAGTTNPIGPSQCVAKGRPSNRPVALVLGDSIGWGKNEDEGAIWPTAKGVLGANPRGAMGFINRGLDDNTTVIGGVTPKRIAYGNFATPSQNFYDWARTGVNGSGFANRLGLLALIPNIPATIIINEHGVNYHNSNVIGYTSNTSGCTTPNTNGCFPPYKVAVQQYFQWVQTNWPGLPIYSTVPTGYNGGNFDGSAFTGTGSGTSLTTTGVTGYTSVGVPVFGTGVPSNTWTTSQTSGTTGGAGVYVTNNSTTSSANALTTNDNYQTLAAQTPASYAVYSATCSNALIFWCYALDIQPTGQWQTNDCFGNPAPPAVPCLAGYIDPTSCFDWPSSPDHWLPGIPVGTTSTTTATASGTLSSSYSSGFVINVNLDRAPVIGEQVTYDLTDVNPATTVASFTGPVAGSYAVTLNAAPATALAQGATIKFGFFANLTSAQTTGTTLVMDRAPQIGTAMLAGAHTSDAIVTNVTGTGPYTVTLGAAPGGGNQPSGAYVTSPPSSNDGIHPSTLSDFACAYIFINWKNANFP